MKSSEFEKWVEGKKSLVGMWRIKSREKSLAPFTIGCYFDQPEGKWKVYKVGERNDYNIRLETEDEDKAYDKLKSMVLFEVENNRGYF